MKKVDFSLETIVTPEDVIKNEIDIRGGTSIPTDPITCELGSIKCKDGDVKDQVALSLW